MSDIPTPDPSLKGSEQIAQDETLRAQRDAAMEAAVHQTNQRFEAETDRIAADQAADQAARERDVALAQRNRLAAERNAAIDNAAAARATVAADQNELAGSRAGFYTMLAVVVLVLLVIAGVYLERGNTPSTTVTINRTAPPIVAPPSTTVVNPTPSTANAAPAVSTPVTPATPAVPAPPAPPVTAAAPPPPPATTSNPTTTTSNGQTANSGSGVVSGNAGGGNSAPNGVDNGTENGAPNNGDSVNQGSGQ